MFITLTAFLLFVTKLFTIWKLGVHKSLVVYKQVHTFVKLGSLPSSIKAFSRSAQEYPSCGQCHKFGPHLGNYFHAVTVILFSIIHVLAIHVQYMYLHFIFDVLNHSKN